MNKNLPHQEFSEWLKYFGRAEELSRKSEILTPPLISKLKNGSTAFGLVHAVEVERLTDGLFRAESLCPKHADLINYLRGEAA